MVSKNKNKLALNIREIRNKLGYSQESLAHKAGIPVTSYSKIEQGQIPGPSVFVVEKIAKALNTKIDNLIN